MAITLEVKEKQKHQLSVLLNLKKLNPGTIVNGLDREIQDAVAVMEPEDVAWVEKIIGIKAFG
jgi:hypothetical protein